MDFSVEKVNYLKRETLDETNYFEDLLKQALKLKIINDNFIYDLQLQLLQLLRIKSERYNMLSSSSIKMEVASGIMKSNIYTIGIYLKEKNPDDALLLLKNNDIMSLYENGKKVINKKIKICRLQYEMVLRNKLNTNNEVYNSTILGGISSFFKVYDYEYNAEDIKITADYPLYNSKVGKLIGIEFIEDYLKSLYIENEFCKMFNENDIENLLNNKYPNYDEVIINIFDELLIMLICKSLAQKRPSSLESKENLSLKTNDNLTIADSIYKLFENKSKVDIYNVIFDSYLRLDIKNDEIKEYIEKGFEKVQFEIYNSYKLVKLDMLLGGSGLF